MNSPRWFWLVPALAVLLAAALYAQTTDSKDKDGKSAQGGASKDLAMVERLLAARKEYQLALETLRKHYISTGDVSRARWAEDELMQYHRMSKQAFSLELDAPLDFVIRPGALRVRISSRHPGVSPSGRLP